MAIKKGELIDELASTLNKKYKGEKIAYNLERDDDSPTNVDEWISTGSTTLDLAISNRLDGGYPIGRIIEIAGWEQSGKSLLAAHAILSTQQKGGIAVYIDTENRTSSEFWKAIGIDVDKVLYVPVDTMERVFEVMESIITKIRASNQGKNKKLVTIVVDSVAAASTEPEKDDDFDKGGWNTDKAIIMSKALRKMTGMIGRERVLCIFTNQLREKMGVQFGDNTTTPGGKALQFHATVRLRLRSIGKIKDDNDMIIGAKTRAEVFKNTVGPPHRKAEFEIYFDRGIDDYSSWYETGKTYDLIDVRGGWNYVDKVDLETGEVLTDEPIAFRSKDFVELLESDPELKENLRKRIADSLIMKYRTQEIDYENTSVVEDEDDDGQESSDE